MKKACLCPAIAGIASLLAVSVSAGDWATYSKSPKQPAYRMHSAGPVGHIGFSTGVVDAREVEGPWDPTPEERDHAWFFILDGSVTLPVSDAWLFTFDAYWRYDDFRSTSSYDDGDDPEKEYILGLHVLRQLTHDTRAGFFYGYGDTRSQDVPRSDQYDVHMLGAEAHHFATHNLMFYGQLGYGFKGRSGEDSEEGFNGGMLGRVGVTYFCNERSAINLDFEAAGTHSYIDGDDSGRFFGTTLNYERLVCDTMPLYFTCFLRYDHINSTDEGDHMDEWHAGFGLRYVFGADSPLEAARKGRSIGMPRLPTRASAWTEYLD